MRSCRSITWPADSSAARPRTGSTTGSSSVGRSLGRRIRRRRVREGGRERLLPCRSITWPADSSAATRPALDSPITRVGRSLGRRIRRRRTPQETGREQVVSVDHLAGGFVGFCLSTPRLRPVPCRSITWPADSSARRTPLLLVCFGQVSVDHLAGGFVGLLEQGRVIPDDTRVGRSLGRRIRRR